MGDHRPDAPYEVTTCPFCGRVLWDIAGRTERTHSSIVEYRPCPRCGATTTVIARKRADPPPDPDPWVTYRR